MAKKRARADGGRYDPLEIARRVDRARRDLDIPVKAIAQDVWPQLGENARFQWYKKANRRENSFSIPELGIIADILRAPPGWPFLPWEVAEDRAHKARK